MGTSWARLSVGIVTMHCAFSSGLCRKTSALFARLLPLLIRYCLKILPQLLHCLDK
jgi:hypothetical protein